jgi:uncharacterized protein (DUF2147 family)
MRRFNFIALLSYLVVVWMLLLTVPTNAQPLQNTAPAGRWMTPHHDAVIQIAPCGPDLCGQIVGIELGPNDPIPRDWAGQTQCHLTIIRTAPHTDGLGQIYWTGAIIDPRDGSIYNAIMTLDPQGRLQLRGYIGLPIFGRTQTWTPYAGPMVADCRLPEDAG